jgi:hypothetical protein
MRKNVPLITPKSNWHRMRLPFEKRAVGMEHVGDLEA